MSVEFAAAFGAWMLAVIVVATAYQVQTSSDEIAHAAGEAARAASLTAAPADAADVAHQTARTRLASGTCQPETVAVQVDLSQFQAGGTVRVTVSCRTRPPVGPSRTASSTAEEVIDRFRGGS